MSRLLREISALESELHHPGVACSVARLEQLLHPQFHEVGRSGNRYDRATVLRYLARQPGPTALAAHDYVLQEIALDCVLLCYQSQHQDGERRQTAQRASIWRQGAQGWQLFYHQGTNIAAAQP